MSKQSLLDLQVRARLRWIQYYKQRITGKVAPTCRYFGISRSTFYLWYHHRYMSLGKSGLTDKTSRPHKITH